MRLPPEFQLLAACCRWPPGPEREAAVRAAAAAVADWDALLAWAARHRVEGLVHDGLSRAGIAVPAPAGAALAAEARRIARDNLAAAAESARLAAAFASEGADLLFVKGVTLGALAWGSQALKRSIDIDAATPPADYPAAAAAMRKAGYACQRPGPDADDAALVAWAWQRKHSVWRRGDITVELHITLSETPAMLDDVSTASPRQQVDLGGGLRLPTLAPEPLFAFLCVHGAMHGWSRLKWLADVGALLSQDSPQAVERLHDSAIALGAGRTASQALLLCADLFGLALPPALEARLRGDRVVRSLARTALRMMVGGGTRELDAMPLATARMHLANLRLDRGWRFKAIEIRRKLALQGGDGAGGALAALPRWLLSRAARARAQR